MDNNEFQGTDGQGNPVNSATGSYDASGVNQPTGTYDASGMNQPTGTYDASGMNQAGAASNPYSYADSGVYDASGINQSAGTYNASAMNQAGTQPGDGNYAAAPPSVDMKPIEEANGKQAVVSLVMGIVLNVLDLVMICSALMGGGFLYGGFFVVVAIVGIQCANTGRHSAKKGMATAGMVLNIIALVAAVILVVLGLIASHY